MNISNQQMQPALIIRDLGIQPYEPVWQDMRHFTDNRDETVEDELWCLQHQPVFTQGQAGKPEHILDPHDIPVVQIDRGGQVTYHGPGQLMVYLLINVRRRNFGPRHLVDLIEQSIIELLASHGITAVVKPGAPGVYVDGAKIAALGLRIRCGCSYHGLSLNIGMDLEPFNWINPCGYEGQPVVQLRDLLDTPPKDLFNQTRDALVTILQRRLNQ